MLNDVSFQGKNVTIYFPIINYTDNSGTLNLDKSEFDNLIKLFLDKYGNYNKSSTIYYSYLNMTYKIKNNKYNSIYKTNYNNIYNNNNILLLTYDEEKIDIENFPIVDKYHNISKKNKMEFLNDSVTISLVTETYTDNTVCYYPEILFINDNIDLDIINDTIDFITNLLLR